MKPPQISESSAVKPPQISESSAVKPPQISEPPAVKPPWRRVAILGTGLIGGSMAGAMRQHGLAEAIIGYGPEARQAQAAGLIDAAVADLAAAVANADLVILAAPPSALPALLAGIAPVLAHDAVVTDVASTKRGVIAAARAGLGDAFGRFVAGHPIAGSEQSGPQAANANLFVGARCVLCPEAETDPQALARVLDLWRAIGARPGVMPASTHDALFAAVSHLPHLAAFALAGALADHEDAARLLEWAGGGLRDTTRIAASSGPLWADILLDNADAVRAAGQLFAAQWAQLEAALEQGDRAALVAQIEKGAIWRRRLPA